jgi:hypothetical protein
VLAHAEVHLEFGQRPAGLGGDGGANRGGVSLMEGHAAVGPRPGRGLAGGGAALLEAADPGRADGELLSHRPGASAGVEGRQHAVAEILRDGFHGSPS